MHHFRRMNALRVVEALAREEAGVSLKEWRSYSNNLREKYRRQALDRHVGHQRLRLGRTFWRGGKAHAA